MERGIAQALELVAPLAGLAIVLFVGAATADAANYDETKVPKYTLPDPLVMQNGERVTDAEAWRTKRRPEILELFRTHVYRRSPARPKAMTFKVFDTDAKALGGKATRKQVSVLFTGKDDGPSMDILIYLPNAAKRPVPTFVLLNFGGNHAIHPDPAIKLPTSWMRGSGKTVKDHRATEAGRGAPRARFPVDKNLARGYALAPLYYGDIDPDYHDGFKNGVHAALDARKGGKRPADAWGSIGAWAWGLGRAMDYFETDDDVDHKHVAVLGHSRLGKTSLWAGARDERFAIVISNDSGCGGAALSRRAFGETVARINTSFPHWFCTNYKKYNSREGDCPDAAERSWWAGCWYRSSAGSRSAIPCATPAASTRSSASCRRTGSSSRARSGCLSTTCARRSRSGRRRSSCSAWPSPGRGRRCSRASGCRSA